MNSGENLRAQQYMEVGRRDMYNVYVYGSGQYVYTYMYVYVYVCMYMYMYMYVYVYGSGWYVYVCIWKWVVWTATGRPREIREKVAKKSCS